MANEQHDTDRSAVEIPLAEETLEAKIVEKEQGRLRIHKRVETDPVREEIELRHDDDVARRVARNEVVEARREPWHEDGALMIPVYEEVLVTGKRLVLREVIRVEQSKRTEQVTVEDEVRREVVDIERIDS